MEKTRTLPPLVRGRVTAVLDFFVDKVNVKNISLLMDAFDLVIQLQWWGEDLPTYVRPQKACYQPGRIGRNSVSVEMLLPCVRYEIKTTLELFKLYLKSCEVLELCILDAITECIIGSAFLRDLTNLLNMSNNFITAPIFDYLGEEIGEVIICFRFLDKSQESISKKNEIMSACRNNSFGKLDAQNFKIPNRAKKSYPTSTDNNSFSNRGEKSYFRDLTMDIGPSMTKHASKKNEKIDYINCSQDFTSNVSASTKKIYIDDVKIPESVINSCKCLPEISTTSDSSKILHFGLSPQIDKQKKYSSNSSKVRIRNKFNANSRNCKSKSKSTENMSSFPFDYSSQVGEFIKKRPASQAMIKYSETKPAQLIDKKYAEDKSSQSEQHSTHKQTQIKDVPSKQSVQTKVLDFLLGSDLSKEDEESAINEFKKMSPSHNLVTSLNMLCLTSDSHEPCKSGIRRPINSLPPPEQADFTFDLTNPIERNYYEKFFLKSELSADLELAQFLNQPENSAVFEKLKSENINNINSKGSSEFSDFKSSEFPLGGQNNQKLNGGDHFQDHYNKVNDKAKGCARCKYYKKLDELDKIIESLKHFETKMLMHEKDMESALMENSKIYIKGNQLNSS